MPIMEKESLESLAGNGYTPPAGGVGTIGMGRIFEQFLDGIELFRSLDPTIASQTMATFLFVAMEPGISLQKLQDRLRISSSATSRNVYMLSEFALPGKRGLDLVYTTDNPQNRREKIIRLTPRGERFATTLRKVVE